jgi:hypothetical protein
MSFSNKIIWIWISNIIYVFSVCVNKSEFELEIDLHVVNTICSWENFRKQMLFVDILVPCFINIASGCPFLRSLLATLINQNFLVKMPEKLTSVLTKFYDEYMNNTSKRLKLVDAYLLYIVLTGVIQFIYCALVGTFPFNSFLSGFISSVGSFILGGNYGFQ